MNKKYLTRTATALLIAITTLAGCKKDPDPIIAVSEMTMTTAIDGRVTIYLAGTREAVIDWGDGSAPETVTLSTFGGFNNSHKYTHTFSDANSRTIVVEGYDITHLACTDLQLTALDVTKNTALRQLSCWDNQLTSLDITKNTTIELLYCSDNQLTSLDVTRNTAMIHIVCAMNQIVSLDVTKNTALTGLDCHGNQLTSLNVTNNTALTYLSCHSNQFTAEGLNTLFGTLHSNAGTKDIYIINTHGTDGCDRSIATAKGWEVH